MHGHLVWVAAAGVVWIAAVAAAAETNEAPASQPASVLPSSPQAGKPPRPILSPEARRQAACSLIDRFVQHAGASPAFDAAARTAVAEGWSKHRSDEEPEEFLTAGLAILSPPFKHAWDAFANEQCDQAEKALRPIVDSPDPYLSLHAKALLARVLVDEERLEEAQGVLEPLAANERELIDKSFLEAEVDFLLGFCQLSNLKYDAARATLEEFLRDHPDAPERWRLPARQMYQELLVRRPESLGEVSDLMVYAGRRLGHRHADEPTRITQDRAVELLSKLIEQAEQQEKQSKACKNCGGKGCQKCRATAARGGNRPSSPMPDSMLPQGPSEVGDLHRAPPARPGEQWGQMRPEERERILQSLRRSFPSRYRQLVEQYYRQLGKER